MKRIIVLVSTVFLLGITTLLVVGCGSSKSDTPPPPRTGLSPSDNSTWIGNYEVRQYISDNYKADNNSTFLVFGNFSITPAGKVAGAMQSIGYAAFENMRKHISSLPVVSIVDANRTFTAYRYRNWVDIIKVSNCSFDIANGTSDVKVIDANTIEVSCSDSEVDRTFRGYKVNNNYNEDYSNVNPLIYNNPGFEDTTKTTSDLVPFNLIGNYMVNKIRVIDSTDGSEVAVIEHEFADNKTIGELSVAVKLTGGGTLVLMDMILKYQLDNATITDPANKSSVVGYNYMTFGDRIPLTFSNGKSITAGLADNLTNVIFPNEGMKVQEDNISIIYTPRKLKNGITFENCYRVTDTDFRGFCYDDWKTALDNQTFGAKNYWLEFHLEKIIDGTLGSLPARTIENKPYWIFSN